MKRKVLLLLILGLLPFLSYGQSGTRIVRGQVKDEAGKVVNDAVITTEIDDTVYQTNPDGTFALSVPAMSRYLFFSKHNCFDVKKEIDGSYIMVVMKLDKKAVENEKKESELAAKKEAEAAQKLAMEQARAEAEAKARAVKEAKAEADAKAKAEKDAAAAAKAEAEARAKAEKAANAAAEKARKEAEREAKAKAETEARLAAEWAAREAAAKARAEQDARERQEKAAKQQLAQEKQASATSKQPKERKKFDIHKLVNSVELGYAYQVFHSNQHPVIVDYTLSYQFSNVFSAGVGFGIQNNMGKIGDGDFPYFGDLRWRFGKKNIRPLIDLKLGISPSNGNNAFADAGAGFGYHLKKKQSLILVASMRVTSWADKQHNGEADFAPCIKIGYCF